MIGYKFGTARTTQHLEKCRQAPPRMTQPNRRIAVTHLCIGLPVYIMGIDLWSVDMDMSMDIRGKYVDMDMDMDE